MRLFGRFPSFRNVLLFHGPAIRIVERFGQLLSVGKIGTGQFGTGIVLQSEGGTEELLF